MIFDNRRCESILRRMSEPESFLIVSNKGSGVFRESGGKLRRTAEASYAEVKELVGLKCLHGAVIHKKAGKLRLSERGVFTLSVALIARKHDKERANA